ncbi:MAG: hypothetical protein M9962_00560 [Oligoflexia bacterium]|nr:hypothetical protein [Oligoflexia bacterium]
MFKKSLVISLSLSFFTAGASFADSCSYCAKITEIKKDFSKVKPDSMNEKTIDKQNALVDRSIELIKDVIKKNPKIPDSDMKNIISLMVVAVDYDYQNLMSEDVLGVLQPEIERFFKTITSLEKEKKITSKQADELRTAMAVAEEVGKSGTDPEAPAEDEVSN